MRVHAFVKCLPPPVTIIVLTRTANEGEAKYGSNVRLFIKHHFYVNDRLKFFSSETEANSTQKVLTQPNALMHKFYPTLPQSQAPFQMNMLLLGCKA